MIYMILQRDLVKMPVVKVSSDPLFSLTIADDDLRAELRSCLVRSVEKETGK